MRDLSTIVDIEPGIIRLLHASFRDFLVDPTCLKAFWINPRARHIVFARLCLQSIQLKGKEDYSLPNVSILICKKKMLKWLSLVFTTQSTISKMRK